MSKTRMTFYGVLLIIAYGFFILMGLAWLVTSFFNGSGFNATAFVITAVFAAQAYFRHRIAHLILGILSLFASIFMVMEVINTFNLMDKHAVYDGLTKALIGMSLVSIVMSVILVFGYLKMSFKEA